jgi:hypothetical protein
LPFAQLKGAVKASNRRHLRLLPPPQRLAPRACEKVRLTHPVAEPELRLTRPVAEPEPRLTHPVAELELWLTHPVAEAELRLPRPVAVRELRPVAESELSEQLPASIVPPRLVEAQVPVPVLLFESGPADW